MKILILLVLLFNFLNIAVSFFRYLSVKVEFSLHAKLKKKTNSKKSFRLQNDEDENLNLEDYDIPFKESKEFVKEKINQLKVNTFLDLEKRKEKNDLLSDNKIFLEPIDSKAWRETVANITKEVLCNRFYISYCNDITTINNDSSILNSSINEENTSNGNKPSIVKLSILSNRIEIVITSGALYNGNINEFNAEELKIVHKILFETFELYDLQNPLNALDVVNRYELLVATPGVGDVLRFDRDFISFQGFKVLVTTSEDVNSKSNFEGSLVGRTENDVIISVKGKKMKIPRALVTQVKLPTPKRESTDMEMKKLAL